MDGRKSAVVRHEAKLKGWAKKDDQRDCLLAHVRFYREGKQA